MKATSVIEVLGVSKSFPIQKIHGDPSLKENIWQNIKSKFSTGQQFNALDNINFELFLGSTLGIIGRNGAGKSTLIKLLSRIIPLTKGQIKISGKISSLIEVGAGFHPDLTGRENIYLNGAFLGLRKKEINDQFEKISKFAEIEEFLDTPLKRFSTGMRLRLAFSIAVFLKSDVVILDEILAVGDMEFQSKCLKKLEEITREENRTVILVSHNIETIKANCDVCLWLDKGKQMAFGQTQEVISKYLSSVENL